METSEIVTLIKESAFLLSTFGIFMALAMMKGRYALINIIFGLYLSLLILLEFPYYSDIHGEYSAVSKIILFGVFVGIGTMLFRRHIPGDDYESAFHAFGKKLLLATSATILVMIFSFHALPVTEIITPGTPIQSLFASEQNFFLWLIAPLFVLFFV